MNKKGVLVVLVAILLTALIVGGGVYFWQRQTFKVTKEDLSQIPLETPQPTQIDKYTGWQTYSNSEFGFTLKFPPTWEKMEIDRLGRGFGPELENPSIVFALKGLETKDEEFIKLRGKPAIEQGVDLSLWINAHTKKQWQELSKRMEQGELVGLKYLAENEQYIFSWERMMRPLGLGAEEGKPPRPPKDLESYWEEMEDIVATFKAI